ncbi:MAG: hypothetical protein N7Q72_05655 [Spiroplasma sp. Tabriz.8]|nr:hypothetical protein [Spiroplasma sp. Tabriz.8]
MLSCLNGERDSEWERTIERERERERERRTIVKPKPIQIYRSL